MEVPRGPAGELTAIRNIGRKQTAIIQTVTKGTAHALECYLGAKKGVAPRYNVEAAGYRRSPPDIKETIWRVGMTNYSTRDDRAER
jgi:hypothetical protein